MPLSVQDNIYVACFLEGIRFPLLYAHLSEICRARLVGVMVDLEAHCLPPATIYMGMQR